jgi:activator of HSP90 ATPase
MVVNNPNNWHWVDKNCIDWSRQYFKERVVGLKADLADQSAEVKSVTSVEGDVVVSQRKGKVISLFDLKIVLGYTGKLGDLDVSGSIITPEVAYDTEEDEYQFEISVFSENNNNTKIKEVVRQKLVPQLRKIYAQFGKDLLASQGSDIQLPSEQVNSQFTKANQSLIAAQQEQKKKEAEANKPAVQETTASTSSSSSAARYNTSTVHFEPSFNTTAEQLYITFLEKNRIGAWTRSNPDFQGDVLKEGSEFKLFGGNIEGSIKSLKANEKIEQLWRLKSWKAGHFATLIIEFHQGDFETNLNVLFKGIPIGEEDAVQENFEDYYIRSIKLTFGFGAVL